MGGVPRVDVKKFIGINSIAAYINVIDDIKDMWLVHEEGGLSLTKSLFEVKGEFYKGERIYRVISQPFYNLIKVNTNLLKELIKKLIEVLDLLQHLKIVHCDLKPENILISYDGKEVTIKVIDFGSAFMHGQEGLFRMATPEYMPPECLEVMKTSTGNLSELSHRTQAWSIDMWSTGAILLEILTGFPLWLSLKGRAQGVNRPIVGQGVFAVKGKEFSKIIQKQVDTIPKLREVLKRYDTFIQDESLINLLERMLDLNAKTRISPKEALKHPALTS